jgi:hypothetical protein
MAVARSSTPFIGFLPATLFTPIKTSSATRQEHCAFAHNKPTTATYSTPHALYLSMKNGKVLQATCHNPTAEADQPFAWIFQACCSADATTRPQ